jgi:hypothetical protein
MAYRGADDPPQAVAVGGARSEGPDWQVSDIMDPLWGVTLGVFSLSPWEA